MQTHKLFDYRLRRPSFFSVNKIKESHSHEERKSSQSWGDGKIGLSNIFLQK